MTTANQALADTHRIIDQWFDEASAPNDHLEPIDNAVRHHSPKDWNDTITRAKRHLPQMMALNVTDRRSYLTTHGCSQQEASKAFNFQYQWMNRESCDQVVLLARDCVSRNQNMGILLERLTDHINTDRLVELLRDFESTRHHLIISMSACRVTDIAINAYKDAMATGLNPRQTPPPPTPEDNNASQILHEATQTMDQQLEELSVIANGWNGPNSRGPRLEDVSWLRSSLSKYWSSDMPIPFIFPMESGDFNIEWYVGHTHHGLEIDFTDRTGLWEWWDSQTDKEHEETLDLTQPSAWQKLRVSSHGRRLAR